MSVNSRPDGAAGGGRASALPFPASSLVLFVLLFIAIAHYLGNLLPDPALRAIIHATGVLSAVFLRALGFAADLRGPYVVLPGFTMEIDLECTALHFLAIFAAGVLVFPGRTARAKAIGLLAGGAIIVAVNILRIAVVGILGIYSPALSAFVHTYLWQGAFVVIVLFIWVVWARGRSAIGRPAARFAAIFLVSSVVAVLALGMVMRQYALAISGITGLLFRILPGSPEAAMHESGAALVFLQGTRAFSFSLSTDIFDSAIFVALMLASPVMGRPSRRAVRLAAGLGVLAALHLAIAVLVGSCAFRISPAAMENLFWIVRAISIISPVLIWLVLLRRAGSGGPGEGEEPGPSP